MPEWRPATDKDGKMEWSKPMPGPYPGTAEITRDGPWCDECQRQHVDRITRRDGLYSRSIGPHWVGQFKTAEEAKCACD